MLRDRYDLPLSTASLAARDAYVEGVDLLLSAHPAEEAFARALAADPALAAAEAGRARMLAIAGRPSEARPAAARARSLASTATTRERRHVEVIALGVDGQGAAALALAREHLAEYPRDAMTLAPATGVFGLIGFSGRPAREEEQRALLDALAPHYGDDWWFLGAHAFAACETGRLEAAQRRVERSLALNPRNANAAHIRAHVLYERGLAADGARFLEEWLPTYPRAGSLFCHLSWHVALSALALGDLDRAWQVYEGSVSPGAIWGPPINLATDAPSFLWRAELAGGPRRPAAWKAVRDWLQDACPVSGVAFVDVHRALALAGAGDAGRLETLAQELDRLESQGRQPAGPVVAALARAFGAFARGDWEGTVRVVEPVLDQHARIGGSRAQRDLIEHTLLAAYLRAGRRASARALLGRLADRRPAVPVAGLGPDTPRAAGAAAAGP
jgi:hypothetical protein